MSTAALLVLLQGCVLITDEEYSWRTAGEPGDSGGDTDSDEPCDTGEPCDEVPWWTDGDGDGYGDPDGLVMACDQPAGTVDNDDDCDDDDPDVALPETWFFDGDGDGYGSSATTEACEPPAGYVENDDDCDDGDETVNPAAEETCLTSGDDDCDGEPNEVDAADCTQWFADGDGDGFGAGAAQCSCAPRDGYSEVEGDDCDDGDASVNPGEEEVCYDGVDNDCDGGAGSCGFSGDVSLVDANGVLWGEAMNDGAGADVALVGDVTGDGTADLAVSATSGDLGGTSSGQVYLVSGAVSGAADLGATADAVLLGAAGDTFGWSVAPVGDTDGDGFDDLLAGGLQVGSDNAGAAYLVWGPVTGSADVGGIGAELGGEAANDYAGCSVSSGGDVFGDGDFDLLVGAYRESTNGNAAGAAYLVDGPLTASASLSAARATFYGASAGDRAGFAVSGGGDVSGDGYADVVVGADRADPSGLSDAGTVYVLFGPQEGDVDLSSADAIWTGAETALSAGYSVLLSGDLDGDAAADVVVGGPGKSGGYTGPGSVFVLTGIAAGSSSLSGATAILTGVDSGDQAGSSIAQLDFDGDGAFDLLVGAPSADPGGDGSGAAYVALNPFAGAVALASAEVRLEGGAAGDKAGYAVSGGGDLNADGADEVLVGATGADDAESNLGAAYLLFGGGR